MVPKPEDNEFLISQPSVPFHIVRLLLGVLSPIHFDYESLLQTDKIYDVGSQGLLSPKLVATQLPQTKMGPQKTLNVGGIIPQFSAYSPVHFPLS